MKYLRNLMAMLLLTVSSTLLADDYAFLSIVQNDGQTNVNISNIKKITFDETNMIIVLNDGNEQKMPLNGLSKMFFSAGATGITTTNADSNKFLLKDGTLIVQAAKGDQVVVYDMNGRAVRTVTMTGEKAEVELKGLSKGVYVVKAGQAVQKVMNK
jgi:hypothetical protein